jgi:hypothetical protein
MKYQKHRPDNLLTRKEVAQKLRVCESYVARHVRPSGWHGNRAYYTLDDISSLMHFIATQKPYSTTLREQREADGFYTTIRAAEIFGIPEITWCKCISKKRVQKPAHKIGVFWCYTITEATEIARQIQSRWQPENAYTAKQLREYLGISKHCLGWILSCNKQLGVYAGPKRKWYYQKDIEAIQRILQQRKARKKPKVKIL